LRVGLLPNLTEGAFSEQIRERLAQIDVAKLLLETEQDIVLSLEDTQGYFDGFTFVGVSSGDLWRSFVSWMCYFYGDLLIQHEISKLAIRRARRLA